MKKRRTKPKQINSEKAAVEEESELEDKMEIKLEKNEEKHERKPSNSYDELLFSLSSEQFRTLANKNKESKMSDTDKEEEGEM